MGKASKEAAEGLPLLKEDKIKVILEESEINRLEDLKPLPDERRRAL